MIYVVGGLTMLHCLSSIYNFYRRTSDQSKELVAQHHETCVMLGLIALAILWVK